MILVDNISSYLVSEMRLYFSVFVLAAFLTVANSQLLLFRLEKLLDYGIANGVKDLNFLLGVAIARGNLSLQFVLKFNNEN